MGHSMPAQQVKCRFYTKPVGFDDIGRTWVRRLIEYIVSGPESESVVKTAVLQIQIKMVANGRTMTAVVAAP